jgi:antitoxin ParD1/3/4
MNISLTPELEALINRKVKSGMYGSASEVVRESLRRMFKDEEANVRVITEEQRQKMEELRQEVLKGVEQIRNGEFVSVPVEKLDAFADEIIQRGVEKREKLKEMTNGNS